MIITFLRANKSILYVVDSWCKIDFLQIKVNKISKKVSMISSINVSASSYMKNENKYHYPSYE